jgi:4-hydroxy-tetrahydrodipicolinate reductase
MGRQVLEQLLSAPDLRLVGALEGPKNPELGTDAGALVGRPTGVRLTDDVKRALEKAQVVVDFSAPDATASVVRAASERGIACVVGTTGLTDDARAAIDEAAKHIAVVAAPNMSIGIQVLGQLLREAIALLGDGFDIEIIEAHHRAKADAPSGTALRLLEIAASARSQQSDAIAKHGRKGHYAQRVRGEIGLHAVRGGDIVGDHTIVLAGDGERIELIHRATSRAVFAAGALRAARWAVGQSPGRYGMGQVLGLR